MFGKKTERIRQLEDRVFDLEIENTIIRSRLKLLEMRAKLLLDHLGLEVREYPSRRCLAPVKESKDASAD